MWDDRIAEAAYTSPSGVRTVFGGYEDVSMAIEKKTTEFSFPDADGSYIQDLGVKGKRYPFRLFFWGDNYDLESKAFLASLLEQGAGKLEHPIYGVSTVVPFGSIKRRDDLVTAANQAAFEVSFWETNDLIFPLAESNTSARVILSVNEFNIAQADSFATADLSTAVSSTSFRNTVLAGINSANSSLSLFAASDESVLSEYTNIYESIKRNISTVPLSVLANQSLAFLQSPSRADAQPSSYDALIHSRTVSDKNSLHINDLFMMGAVSASVLSAVNTTYTSKPQAIAAAETVSAQFDAVVAWRDDAFNAAGVLDTGEAYMVLQEAVALLSAYLVEISFSLLQENIITIDRDRTIIDLCAELYGDVDNKLTFLIQTNDFSGSEILELKRGREIVYYI